MTNHLPWSPTAKSLAKYVGTIPYKKMYSHGTYPFYSNTEEEVFKAGNYRGEDLGSRLAL